MGVFLEVYGGFRANDTEAIREAVNEIDACTTSEIEVLIEEQDGGTIFVEFTGGGYEGYGKADEVEQIIFEKLVGSDDILEADYITVKVDEYVNEICVGKSEEVSLKIREDLLNKARQAAADLIPEDRQTLINELYVHNLVAVAEQRGIRDEDLDDKVHDICQELVQSRVNETDNDQEQENVISDAEGTASEVNNGGLASQLLFLLGNLGIVGTEEYLSGLSPEDR